MTAVSAAAAGTEPCQDYNSFTYFSPYSFSFILISILISIGFFRYCRCNSSIRGKSRMEKLRDDWLFIAVPSHVHGSILEAAEKKQLMNITELPLRQTD